MRCSRLYRRLVVALALVLASCEPPLPRIKTTQLPGGDSGGVLEAVVRDLDGQALARATIVIRCECLPGDRYATTNQHGVFRFQQLPDGDYAVVVFSESFSFSSRRVRIRDGRGLRLEVTLDPRLRDFARPSRPPRTRGSFDLKP